MRVLGALLAGGRSSRFGSDKALAFVDGRLLIDHASDALRMHADSVVLCGRSWPGIGHVADRPAGGAGPLAGLNAALRHAESAGFDAVLCAPVDVHPLARALPLLDGGEAAVLRTQWAVGIWPVALGPRLDSYLADGGRSIRGWLDIAKPRLVDDAHLELKNINSPADLLPLTSP